MRIDSRPPPIIQSPERGEVKALTAVYEVKPVAEEDRARQETPLHHQDEHLAPRQHQQRRFTQDRRIMCRRVLKQAVLIELRSGVDRRKAEQRDGEVRFHIDERV